MDTLLMGRKTLRFLLQPCHFPAVWSVSKFWLQTSSFFMNTSLRVVTCQRQLVTTVYGCDFRPFPKATGVLSTSSVSQIIASNAFTKRFPHQITRIKLSFPAPKLICHTWESSGVFAWPETPDNRTSIFLVSFLVSSSHAFCFPVWIILKNFT